MSEWKMWTGPISETAPRMKLDGARQCDSGQIRINTNAYELLGRPNRIAFFHDGENRFAIAKTDDMGPFSRAIARDSKIVSAKKFLQHVGLLYATEYFPLKVEGKMLVFTRADVNEAAKEAQP